MSPLPPLADIRASHAPAVVILGNDALLAARPATPVQLAHACLAAGFRAAIPGSWGDELVADATLAALSTRTARPAIHCACPHVARRVLAVGSDLASHLVSLVAPPIAAARYLRLHSAEVLRVTYVGRCPAAADDAIDARLTPEELLAQLADRGIDPAAQPEVFESVIPPDRRRHLSLPGGIPSVEMLSARTHCAVAAMKGTEFAAQLADLVLAGGDTLIDPAPMVGCACTGAMRGESAEPRASVMALEPPRSPQPVVEEIAALHLELALPLAARTATDLVADLAPQRARYQQRILDGPIDALGDAPPSPPTTPNRRPRLTPPGIAVIPAVVPPASGGGIPPRRRSPMGTPRVVPGSVPFASDSEGRVLPRAYVARRRSPRSGIAAVAGTGDDLIPSTSPADSGHPRPPAPTARAVSSLAAAPVEAPAPVLRSSVGPEPRQASTPSVRDSERAVVRSVEPAPVRPAADEIGTPRAAARAPVGAPVGAPDVRPAVVTTAVLAIRAWPARVMSVSAFVRRNPRAVGAVMLAAAGLLVGVAIGYSAARRGNEQPRSATGAADSAAGPAGEAFTSSASGARESVSAGGIAPAQAPLRRSVPRASARQQPAGGRPGPAAPSVRRSVADAAVPPAPAPPATAQVAPTAPAVDTTAARAQRDSVARVDAVNAERESIRREIERRRARVDSIERARLRLDSLRRAEQGGGQPPHR